MINNMERTFVITYNYPFRYKGSYVVKAEDGFKAGEKVSKYLAEKYGATNSSNSVVIEVYDNQLIYI